MLKRLVLISAASGFGKTTLLADIYRHLTNGGTPCLWLSITEGDHDASWLARVLVEQLARLFNEQPVSGEDFGTLASRLVGERTVVVMIDNWNFIESDSTNALLDRIIAESDGLANFIVTSRTVPGFVFEALRLSGSFAGFSSRDLAFTTEEARQVLSGAAPLSLHVFGLIERTEGWPAGVQLLKLALEQSAAEVTPHFNFSGSRSDVADYLGKAFFRQLPVERRAFLCNIAVLEELSSEIAAQVLDDPGAAQTFNAVEHENLFLTEAVDGSGRYRFHSLFRDFLLSQRAREATIDEATVLGRAANYHRNRGELELAIRYAIQGGQRESAVTLLELYGPLLSGDGKVFQYAQWVEALRRKAIPTSSTIDHWYCWSLVFSGRWREVMAIAPARAGPADAEISSIVAAFSDDQETLAHALAAWPKDSDRGNPFRAAVLQTGLAIAALAHGDVDKAIEATHRARFAIDRTEAVFGRVWVSVITAFALLLNGKANQADSAIRDGTRVAERMLGARAPVARIARMMAAIVAWYRCSDGQAVDDLRAADLSADEHGLPIIVVWASAVAKSLNVAWHYHHIENDLISPAVALVKEAYSVEAHLQCMPDKITARELVDAFDCKIQDALKERPALLAEGWMLRDLYAGIQARLMILEGNPEAALELLAPAINDCQRRGRLLFCLQLTLLRICALQKSGKPSAALRALIQVTEQAGTNGLFRPLKGECAFIEPLLPALAEAGQRAPLGGPDGWQRLAASLQITQWASPAPEKNELISEQGPDPLTDRELEMLGFIEIGLRNQEIGKRLGIKVPTVKWHLHNLFSKIGVRNRSSAVRFAREHKLLKN